MVEAFKIRNFSIGYLSKPSQEIDLGMNLGCVSMWLRLVRRWMTSWRKMNGDETRAMNLRCDTKETL